MNDRLPEIDGYRVLELLGMGGIGRVFLAEEVMEVALESAARAAAALVLVLSTALVAHGLAWELVGRRRLLLRLGAMAIVGMGLATGALHVLRPLGLFRLDVAMVGAPAMAVAWLWTPTRRQRVLHQFGADARSLRRLHRAHGRSRYRALTVLFALPASFIVLRSLMLPPLGWDAITYHSTRAALWVQTGQATFDHAPGTWSLYRNFPTGAEALFAWVMLPFHSDLYVGFASALQWLGVGLAMWAFGRSMGLREPWSGVCAATAIFLPPLQLTVSSGYVEPALYACLFMGFAASCEFLRRPAKRLLLLAGLALGLAAGIKLPGAVPAAVMLAVLLVRILATPGLLARWWQFVVAGAVAATAFVFPCMWQAWQDTGYPLSPMPIELFGITLGVADPAMAWYLDRPTLTPYVLQAELSALKELFALPGSTKVCLGALTLLPLALMPAGLLRLARSNRRIALALALSVASVVGLYYTRGISVSRLGWSASVSRYVASAVLIALPVSAWASASSRWASWYHGTLLLIAGYYGIRFFRFGWAKHETPAVLILGVILAITFALFALAMRRLRPQLTVVLLVVFVSLFSSGLQIYRDATRSLALRACTVLHELPRYWVPAAAAIDDVGRPERIAMTAGSFQNADNWFSYFLLGRRLQNRITYVPVSHDGQIVPFGPDGSPSGVADEAAWLQRVTELRITAVMAFIPAALEVVWMERHPERFVRIAGTGPWGLFRVRP